MQLIDGSTRCDTLLDLLLTKKEDPTKDMKAEGSLGSRMTLGSLKSWKKWERSIVEPQAWTSVE